MRALYTTKGLVNIDDIKYFLPHEHVVLSLGAKEPSQNNHIDENYALSKITPFLNDALSKGINVLGECSPIGTGRNTAIMKKASDMTGMPIVVSTGMYCDQWIPSWVNDMNYVDLAKIFIKEITDGVDETGVKAGLIKVGIFKDNPTDKETKVMRAAACASKETGCAILAHAMNWISAKSHIDILKEEQCDFSSYIWAHSHREYNTDYHLRALELGCYLEYDGIGLNDDDDMHVINLILKIGKYGFKDKVLISQDRGWFDPCKENGGQFREYTYMTDIYIDKMKHNGIDDSNIELLLKKNPYNAIARKV